MVCIGAKSGGSKPPPYEVCLGLAGRWKAAGFAGGAVVAVNGGWDRSFFFFPTGKFFGFLFFKKGTKSLRLPSSPAKACFCAK